MPGGLRLVLFDNFPAGHGLGTIGAMLPLTLQLTLPAWFGELADPGPCRTDDAAMVEVAIALARRNVAAGSGGPFGAVVFDGTGRVVGAGVNRVLPTRASLAHAEMLAFTAAQQRLGRYRLNRPDQEGEPSGGPFTLATSAQPCAMCFGASLWAGIDRMLIAARSEDVERLAGFDEGPLPADWQGALAARGIAVRRDLLREEACAVLADYAAGAGVRY